MLSRYGEDNPGKVKEFAEKISKTLSGGKNPRVLGQQQKIIDSKRKNGTLKHTVETKNKIRVSINKLYASDNPPITISENNHKNHKTGYVNGIFCRSSYELKFLEYCYKNDIECVSAETKEFRVPYFIEGKRKWYYPDFYLEKYDVVIEIKPNVMLLNDIVQEKICNAMKQYRLLIIDEEYLCNLDEFFGELDEYFCTFE